MRRLLLMMVGLGFLAVAAVLLWIAYGPQPSEERTTGGVLYTQAEVAAELQVAPGAPNLDTVTDVQAVPGGPNTIEFQTQVDPAAAADLSSVDDAEIQAAPSSVAGEAERIPASTTPLTTDVVIAGDTAVAVAPVGGTAAAPGDGQGGAGGALVGYEQRVVELEWPDEFRVGRGGLVRVRLKVLADGSLQPVAEIAENEVLATPILITDRYDTHDGYVTATLSAPDFDVDPTTPTRQLLQRGTEPEWRWTLEADNSGSFIIVLGLTLDWQPKVAGAPQAPTNVPIWGQTVQVESNYVFGSITVPQAGTAGTVLAVLGFVAQIPLLEFFVEIFWKILFGGGDRRRDSRRRSRRDNRRNNRR